MSNTRRPSAARQHTRTSDKNADDELERGIRVTLEGEIYEVRIGDVTSTLARELRRSTGMSFQQLMREIVTDPDSDTIASFVWIARRIAGEEVDVDDVVVTYDQILGSDFDVDLPGKRAEADSPEA